MSNIQCQKYSYIYLLKILLFLIFLIVSNPDLSSQEQQHRTTRVLNDGTTIIHTYDESHRLYQEDIILKSGRHKTTYFDAEEKPKYGVVMTGTGSFGLMYYDQTISPLFKFWDYGNNDTIIQFFSSNSEPMRIIRMSTFKGERKIKWEDEKWHFNIGLVIIILSSLLGMIVAFFTGILIGRRSHAK